MIKIPHFVLFVPFGDDNLCFVDCGVITLLYSQSTAQDHACSAAAFSPAIFPATKHSVMLPASKYKWP